MLKLILMRHSKSSPSGKEGGDFDRPLSERGEEAALRIGRALAERGLVPACVLCSPARRTRETLSLVLEAMKVKPPVHYRDRLYAFGDGAAYLDEISQQEDASPLLLIGHNPSTQILAQKLAASGDLAAIRRMSRKFSTSAAAVIAFPIRRWPELRKSNDAQGELQLFLTPKMLKQ